MYFHKVHLTIVWVTLWLIKGQTIRELGCCNLNLNMWLKFLKLKMKIFSQHGGKALRLHVKGSCMWIQKHVVWLQWSDSWKNVKGSNPKLLKQLPSLKLRLWMSLQYLEWHWANKNHGMVQFLDCWKGFNAKYDG
jgi:hypothetical protein